MKNLPEKYKFCAVGWGMTRHIVCHTEDPNGTLCGRRDVLPVWLMEDQICKKCLKSLRRLEGDEEATT